MYVISCSIPWQRGNLSPLFNAEAPQAVAPTQYCETLVGDTGSARHELQQAQPLFIIEVLHRGPEPAHHNVPIMVTWKLTVKLNVKYEVYVTLVTPSRIAKNKAYFRTTKQMLLLRVAPP